MKHPYTVGCACNRCVKEEARRETQSAAKARTRESRREGALYRQARWHYDHGDHEYSMNG